MHELKGPVPAHIAVVLDGNRRFASRLMKTPWMGHVWGARKVREFLGWCRDAGVRHATLYAFSVQNFARPRKEFDYLMKLFEKEFRAIADPKHDAHKYGVRVRFLGRIHLLPAAVRAAIRAAEKATARYSNYFVNIAVAYGGQEEITDAMRDVAEKVRSGKLDPSDINENTIRHSLYTNGAPYPDMILRTGGEHRLSNFLLWQGAYSELVFIKKTWPELTKRDFVNAIKDFQSRERRFGA
jgi:tritrans,polycis-undecaprenyl-diphosphate synthase [geranylgeranyl-diphosphate specific]